MGRLRPGADLERARRDLGAVAQRLQQQYPVANAGRGASVVALKSQMVDPARNALLVMLGAVGLVLLMACANVANLLLVRATARETEIAVRTALGASRWRVVRQILVESIVLSVSGFVLGAALAAWAVKAIVAFGPHGLPRLDEIAVNLRVLSATACLLGMGTKEVMATAPLMVLLFDRTFVAGSFRTAWHRLREKSWI